MLYICKRPETLCSYSLISKCVTFMWTIFCARNTSQALHMEMNVCEIYFLLYWLGLHGFEWGFSHDSSCSPDVLRQVVTSRRSLPLVQSPRCSYVSRLSRSSGSIVVVIRLPRTDLAVCVTVPPGEGRQTAARQGTPTSHHPHSSSDIPQRVMTLANWSRNTREKRKNDGGLWRMYKRFPSIQVRLLLTGTSQRCAKMAHLILRMVFLDGDRTVPSCCGGIQRK